MTPAKLVTEKLVEYLHKYGRLYNMVEDLIEVSYGLLQGHEEAGGSCKDCLADGRGTHAEQLEHTCKQAEKLLRELDKE